MNTKNLTDTKYPDVNAKHMHFKLASFTGKTFISNVRSKSSNDLLGEIKWYGPWRQYCFFPVGNTIYSFGCMEDINNFISKAMELRK